MSRLQNRVFLIGYVGIDPDIRTFSSGNKKATIRLATKRFSKDAKGEFIELTDWHTVGVFGNLVGIVESYIFKGVRIGVEGVLTYRPYDAPDGSKKYFTEIICNELELLGGGNEKTLTPSMEENFEKNN